MYTKVKIKVREMSLSSQRKEWFTPLRNGLRGQA